MRAGYGARLLTRRALSTGSLANVGAEQRLLTFLLTLPMKSLIFAILTLFRAFVATLKYRFAFFVARVVLIMLLRRNTTWNIIHMSTRHSFGNFNSARCEEPLFDLTWVDFATTFAAPPLALMTTAHFLLALLIAL